MYCPSCGSEERQVSQFCRACGADLRAVRISLGRPDAITDSAASARDEIGRAVAAKIREFKKAGDLAKVAEEVLPEIEKFLESPQEKRLRRLREGVVWTAIGLGATVFFFLMGLMEDNALFVLTGIGVTGVLIGLGIILNALLLTVPKDIAPDRLEVERRRLLDQVPAGVVDSRDDLVSVERTGTPPSVTEHTTQHLADERPAERDTR